MTVKPVLRAGHPVLAAPSEPVADPTSADIASLLVDMEESMEAAGGTGIAAPQIGVGKAAVLIRVGRERVTDDPEDTELPLTALINPEIEPLGDDVRLGWEGCLSLPGMRGEVPRHHRIRYHATGPDGQVIDRVVSGFHARVVQHEVDHLLGILYPHRMTDMTRFGYAEEMLAAELEKMKAETEPASDPTDGEAT